MLIGGVLTLLGAATALAALIALHVLPTGLSPLRDAVSHYGITRFRAGYRALTIAMAVSGVGAGIGVYSALHGRTTIVLAALGVFVLSRAVISWFPMDEPGELVTPLGVRHVLLALLAFVSIFIAAVRLGRLVDRADVWADWQGAFVGFDVLFVLGLLAMVVTRRLPGRAHLFGAAERYYYGVMLGWLTFVGLALIANG